MTDGPGQLAEENLCRLLLLGLPSPSSLPLSQELLSRGGEGVSEQA